MVKVALLQQTAEREFGPNLDWLSDHIRDAASKGARFILAPENCAMLEPKRELHIEKARAEEDHPLPPLFSKLAQETKTWLLAGSIAAKLPDGRMANRSLLFSPDGKIAARYEKIHLFDVDLPNGERYRESATFAPGERAVVAETEFGKIGLSICYDMRFPQLYRSLAKAGASILTMPSAFTVPTGEAHWHVLLRARAIETGCFVLAPAQTGSHAEGRRTYGHSLVVSPWGEVLADGGQDAEIIYADLDLDEVIAARGRVPSLQHDRVFDPA
ncbi:carbon-nitrogen hydrolase family protein [Lacibacterium aquatile]|uniref:Carbon-nitrogen hydrolase family protein n=1 Tax=Lacibacterium aquatile TaxID=1168082 RepID=A0ABW5DLC1_9PROT